jgi:hypothetical protein
VLGDDVDVAAAAVLHSTGARIVFLERRNCGRVFGTARGGDDECDQEAHAPSLAKPRRAGKFVGIIVPALKVSIVISAKGAGESRQDFDATELTVGRVDGNDLVLADGSVSKKHARLMLRAGQVTVTDLESANGTYVNGRKITRATIVREEDAIYIGDFVLRIELPKEK